ncbi:MAG TPA: hypothetical protein VFL99_16545 [Segeticoccus sp.]|uniref:hypothetical protein n=1 Tax=Segeticoccus sp. TaxID=2706531 RepID=UPI002D803FFE|nr:hypothetical protein [Segeticoccus sp.]HET8601935.1 hypothetical protein [Segeticoccus sp.]
MTEQDRPEERLPHDAGDEVPTERIELPSRMEAPTERIEAPATWAEPPTERARGPHAPTILMALVCLAVAALAIARQVTGFVGLTWSGSGPAVIVGAGVVLLAVGALGLLRDRREPHQR